MRLTVSTVVLAVAVLVFSSGAPSAAESGAARRLFAAVWANDLGAVRRIVAKGVDPFAVDENGMAPVDIAIDRGHFDIAHYLLAVQNQRAQRKSNVPARAPAPQPDTSVQKNPAIPGPYITAGAPPQALQKAIITVTKEPPRPSPRRVQMPQTIQMMPAPAAKKEPAKNIRNSQQMLSAPKPVNSLERETPPVKSSEVAKALKAPLKTKTVSPPALPQQIETTTMPVSTLTEKPVVKSRPRIETARVGSVKNIPQPNALDHIMKFLQGQKPEQPPSNLSPPVNNQTVLRSSDMTLGEIGQLGRKLGRDQREGGDCIEKPAWGSHFCIENINWPQEIASAFGPANHYISGGKAIVRYDGRKASQYHVLFPARAFNRMARYFKNRFGPPSETPEIWTSMLGEPKRFNKTLRWRAPMTNGEGYLIAEIREIDDLRWSAPPDIQHGVVRLYKQGAQTVFKLLTMADLLLMQVRQGTYQKGLRVPTSRKSKG